LEEIVEAPVKKTETNDRGDPFLSSEGAPDIEKKQ
jgi:hypothetical protein